MTAKQVAFHEGAHAKTALQNAASIAGLILTTDCMVAELREEQAPTHTHGPDMEM